MIELTHSNIRLFAARHYENSSCLGEQEFLNDFFLASKIDRLLEKGDPNIRKTINLLVTFCNVFSPVAATRILFFHSKNESKLKTLLVTTNRFPEEMEYEYPYELDSELLELLIKEFK